MLWTKWIDKVRDWCIGFRLMASEIELRRLSARRACREIANEVLREAAAAGLDALVQEKQDFWRANNFNAEVLNGGLAQYFTNSSGQEYRETLESLGLTGAFKQRDILQRCVNALSPAIDLTDRNQVGRQVFGDPSLADAIGLLDKEYYASLESFYEAMLEFALTNKAVFQIE